MLRTIVQTFKKKTAQTKSQNTNIFAALNEGSSFWTNLNNDNNKKKHERKMISQTGKTNNNTKMDTQQKWKSNQITSQTGTNIMKEVTMLHICMKYWYSKTH